MYIQVFKLFLKLFKISVQNTNSEKQVFNNDKTELIIMVFSIKPKALIEDAFILKMHKTFSYLTQFAIINIHSVTLKDVLVI